MHPTFQIVTDIRNTKKTDQMIFTVINNRNNLRTTHRRKTTIKLINLSRMFLLKIYPQGSRKGETA